MEKKTYEELWVEYVKVRDERNQLRADLAATQRENERLEAALEALEKKDDERDADL